MQDFEPEEGAEEASPKKRKGLFGSTGAPSPFGAFGGQIGPLGVLGGAALKGDIGPLALASPILAAIKAFK